MVIPFMTVYLTQRLHFSVEQAGFVMACFGVGSVIGAFAGGRLSDRIGFYSVQFWSLLLQGFLLILLGQMQTLVQISVCIFVLSCVGEAFRPANSAAIVHYSSIENRTRSYSLARLAVNLGWSVGPALGGILASYSYDLLFWADGCTSIIAILIMRFFLPPVRKSKEEKKEAAIKIKDSSSVYKDGLYLAFIGLVTVFAIGFFQLSTMVPLYMASILHMNEAHIGITIGTNGLIIALIEMVLIYQLEGRKHGMQFIIFGVILGGLSFVSFNLLPGILAPSIIFILLFTVGEMFSIPFMTSFSISRSGEHNRGQYAALYTIAYSICTIVAPSLGGYMVEHYGFTIWWYITAGTCIATGAGFYMLYKKLTEGQLKAK
ncbi:Predicted arabinose efflux permease, MFS family [Chitinophaga sp. CF118]|nr:Predicted arabinose efflux permease, MFS family [Chitinophaga sp. CF118]